MLPRNFSRARALVLGCTLILITGCSGLKIKNMVPASLDNVSTHHVQSIRIGSVSGNKEEYFGGPELVNSEELKTVLKQTFTRSKLFSAVDISNPDLEISAKFLAHGRVVSNGFNPENAMVIEYWLVDLRNGREIWRQAFNSRNKATLGDALGGAARIRIAEEGCVRKNVEQLVEALNSLAIK